LTERIIQFILFWTQASSSHAGKLPTLESRYWQPNNTDYTTNAQNTILQNTALNSLSLSSFIHVLPSIHSFHMSAAE